MTRPTLWRVEAANAPARLREVGDEMDAILSSRGASEGTRFAARLVCEEVVLNAFEHGGASFVSTSLGSEANPRVLVFEDDGVSFDPAARSVERRSDARGGVSPRGRGLILVRSSTRHIEHRRANGRNRLTVLLVE